MVYKTAILSEIVKYDESEEKIQFNHALMNEEQKLLFLHYKREIFKEAIIVAEGGIIKLDESVMKAISASVDELDVSRLNSRQKFLIDCCIKELEKKTNPDVYNEHKLQLKRKRNNECASKFREKRRKIEKVNDIIKDHLKEIFRDHVKALSKENVEQIRRFLSEKNLINSLNLLENYKKRFEANPSAINSNASDASYLEDDDKSCSSSNENTNMSDDFSSSVSNDSNSRREQIMLINTKVEHECENPLKNIKISSSSSSTLNYKKHLTSQYEKSILMNNNSNIMPVSSTTVNNNTSNNNLQSAFTNLQRQQATQQALLQNLQPQYLATSFNQNNQTAMITPVILIPAYSSQDYYNMLSNLHSTNANNSKLLISSAL